jgi:hypothetical protein
MEGTKKNNQKKALLVKKPTPILKNNFPGYPAYPIEEDLYEKSHEEKDLDPEDISETKFPNTGYKLNRVKDFGEDVDGNDLDIPGSELDDEMEKVGSEDEENNYYSIGGDDHIDLDENLGN